MEGNSFKELINLLNRDLFMACVDKYQTDKYRKYHDSWSHLILLLYCHFNNIFSLRQLKNAKDYPVECKLLSKSHFSYQNNHRNFRLFKDFYLKSLEKTKTQHKKNLNLQYFYKYDLNFFETYSSLLIASGYFKKKGNKIKNMQTLNLPYMEIFADKSISHEELVKKISFSDGNLYFIEETKIPFELLNILDQKNVLFCYKRKCYSYLLFHKTLFDCEIIGENMEVKRYYFDEIKSRSCDKITFFDNVEKVSVDIFSNIKQKAAEKIVEIHEKKNVILHFHKYIVDIAGIPAFWGISGNAIAVQFYTKLLLNFLLKQLKGT